MIQFAVLVAVAAAFAWLVFGGRGGATAPGARRAADDGIDHAELEEAERDVRDAPDEEHVRDWGPGAPKRPPPPAA